MLFFLRERLEKMANSGVTYEDAGVDVKAGDYFADMVSDRVSAVWPETKIGGFAGEFGVPDGAKIAIGSVDGDGTKPDLARRVGKYDVVGIGAVAMSTVDAYVAGAMPAAVLDYIVVEHLVPKVHIEIVEGVIAGCKLAGCKLIGGETAEHPGVGHAEGYFDIATFCVGFPDPAIRLKPKEDIKPGMTIWGWDSLGLGSNGYSLARKVLRLCEDRPSRILERLERYHRRLGMSLADALLVPTAIHIQAIEELRANGVEFVGHAHITGGGMPGNIPRILPDDCVAEIDLGSWEVPPIFHMIQQRGRVEFAEMAKTFNLGAQMVSVTPSSQIIDHPACHRIGEIQERVGDEAPVLFHGKF